MTCMQLPLLLGSVSPGSLVLGCPITNVSKLSLSWHTCSRHVYTWRHVAGGGTDLGPRPAHPHLAGGGGGGARAEVGVVVGRHGPAATTEGAAHSEPEEDED